MIPWKTTEYMGYDIIQSYQWKISSETVFWFIQQDFGEVFLKKSNNYIASLCESDSFFVQSIGKGLPLTTTV